MTGNHNPTFSMGHRYLTLTLFFFFLSLLSPFLSSAIYSPAPSPFPANRTTSAQLPIRPALQCMLRQFSSTTYSFHLPRLICVAVAIPNRLPRLGS
ncbi:hypothetical protein KSP40_PGU019462 [Platanthera guangdongensis]|uniref:Secreted protein n=1 Tax=Platanthera guangdongensis TaxID=2320717 RepID=A0ABR2MTD2_9ASPA